jgi:hypothetical protein
MRTARSILLFFAFLLPALAARAAPRPVNILISIDGFRADISILR